MAKFPEADERLFKNVFICMKCGTKNKANPLKVKNGKIKCRECRRSELRIKHRVKKGT